MRKIVTYLIDNPLVARLAIVFIILSSIFGFMSLKRSSYPRVDLHKVEIRTFYPGASPNDVELNVTNKIEYILREIEGIRYYESRSMENQSRVIVTLEQNAKGLSTVKDDIRRAVDNISDLPSELLSKPSIFEVKIDNFPIYDVSLVNNQKNTQRNMRYLEGQFNLLKVELEKVKGISKVQESGKRNKEIQIQLDLDKLNKYQVSFEDVVSSIQQNKLRVSGGKVESFINEKGIMTLSEFMTPGEIGEIIIRSNFSGKRVLLKDISSIRKTKSKENIITRYNGKKGKALWLYKNGNADLLNVIEDVKKVVAEFEKKTGDKILYVTTHDLSVETRSRLKMVYQNIFLGFILVLIVLLIFYEKEIAIWTAFGIPMSLAISMVILPWIGVTINSISLCGIIVVLGMIVDDAIIISESIHREKKRKNKNAALDGLSRVLKPVTCTILTTIIAFMPIYFIPGVIGQFAKEIPSVVIIILVGSFLEAAFFLPFHLSASKKESQDEAEEGTTKIGQIILGWIREVYGYSLLFLIKARVLTLPLIIVGTVFGIAWSYYNSQFKMFPEHQASRMYVALKVEPGKKLEFTEKRSVILEEIIEEMPSSAIRTYRTRIGRNLEGNYQCTRCFYSKIELTPFDKRNVTALELKKMFERKFRAHMGREFSSLYIKIHTGAPDLGKDVELRVSHQDDKIRRVASNRLAGVLKKFKTNDLERDDQNFEKIIIIKPLYKNISRLQTSVLQVASTIRTAFEGIIVSELTRNGEREQYRVVLDEKFQNFNNPLKDIKVQNKLGNLIKLDKLVWWKEESIPSVINHFNGQRSTKLTGEWKGLKSRQKKEIINSLEKEILDLQDQYPGLNVEIKGKQRRSFKKLVESGAAFILAIVAIYFFLVLQFNSFWLPFLICSSIPIGLVGIGYGFYLHQLPISFMAMIGIIGFSGVVINDALVMVDLFQVLRKKHQGDVLNLIVEGAKERFTPIFLTTLTTLAGLLPSIYGIIGGVDAFISPMVLAMGAGLLFGTISDLILIPIIYAFVYIKRK